MHRNSEHYPDPTFGGAYDSIRQMEKAFCTGKKYIPWVYIASVSYTHLTLPTISRV